MDKKQALLMLASVLVLAIAFYLYGTEPSNEIVKTGSYYDEAGTLLGECVTRNIEKEFIMYTEFYNLRGNLVGKCSEYYGPRNPTWKGGCDQLALANSVAYRLETGINEGKIARKYSCVIE